MKILFTLLFIALPYVLIAQSEKDPAVLVKNATAMVEILTKMSNEKADIAKAAGLAAGQSETVVKIVVLKDVEQTATDAKKALVLLIKAKEALKLAEKSKTDQEKLAKAKEDLAKAKGDAVKAAKKAVKEAQDKLDSSLEAANKAYTSLTDDPEPEKKEEAEDKGSKEFAPFRLWLGTNLDLLDGVSVGKLYGNLDFTTPLDIKKVPFIFSFGLMQNRTVSVDSSYSRQIITDALVERWQAPVNDSIEFIRTVYRNKPTLTTNNLGFYTTIGVRIFQDGATHKVTGLSKTLNTFNVYLAVRSEFFRRQFVTKNNYSVLSQDTLKRPVTEQNYIAYRTAPNRTLNRYYAITGIAVPLIIVTEALEVRFTPYVGISLDGGKVNRMGNISFSVTEKQLGLSVGGEFRKLDDSEPAGISIFIAKSLTIKDVKDLFKFN